jgi:cytochrome c oxidase assembly protein subunit 15
MARKPIEIPPGLYGFAVLTSCCTVLLLMAGALVTSNDAADSVPDWPLAYHKLIPPLVGGIRFEYSHRVLAAIVSVLTLILAVWITRSDRRRLARRMGWNAVALVIAQALLGGIRVLEGDPAVSATAHATLAQIFFITLVGLTLYLSPWWQSEQPQLADTGSPRATTLGLWTTAALLAQIVLGAAFRHGAFGIVPHLVGAGVVTVMVVWTGRAVKKRFREVRALRLGVILLHATFGLQLLLGGAAWWAMTSAIAVVQPTSPFVVLTVAHVLGGALTLAASTLLTLSCFRLIRPARSTAAVAAGSRIGTSSNEGSPERAGV